MSMFKPSDMSEGGGLLDDFDGTITEARTVMFDYQGSGPSTPSILLKIKTEDGEAIDQNWSVGKASDWQPSEDGKKLIPIGRATSLVASSNAGILMASIVNAGFPEDKIGDDISVLEGLKAHFIRVPAPERKGIVQTPRADGKTFEKTILTVSRVLQLPWDAAKPVAAKVTPPKGKPAASSKPAAAAASTGDIQAEAVGILLAILSDNDGTVEKKALPGLVMKAAADNPNKSKLVQTIFSDAFLGQEGQGWIYADGTVVMG